MKNVEVSAVQVVEELQKIYTDISQDVWDKIYVYIYSKTYSDDSCSTINCLTDELTAEISLYDIDTHSFSNNFFSLMRNTVYLKNAEELEKF